MVSSVVNVCHEAKSLTDHPKYKAKMDEIFKIYGDVLSGNPCKNPPGRGAFGEATIPLKQGYGPLTPWRVQMKGERKQAMAQILKEIIERGWIEPCSSDCPPHPPLLCRAEKNGGRMEAACGLLGSEFGVPTRHLLPAPHRQRPAVATR